MRGKSCVSRLAAAALGLACSAASAKDMVRVRYGDIDSLDPHRATSTLSLQVWSLIYDTLLAADKDGKPAPISRSPGHQQSRRRRMYFQAPYGRQMQRRFDARRQ